MTVLQDEQGEPKEDDILATLKAGFLFFFRFLGCGSVLISVPPVVGAWNKLYHIVCWVQDQVKKRKVQPAAPEVETCPSPKLQRLNAMMFDQIEDSGVPGPESGPLSWTEWHDEVWRTYQDTSVAEHTPQEGEAAGLNASSAAHGGGWASVTKSVSQIRYVVCLPGFQHFYKAYSCQKVVILHCQMQKPLFFLVFRPRSSKCF